MTEATTPAGDWKTKLAWAAIGPALLVVAYFWGAAYSDIRMSGWGFGSYDPELSPPEVYMQAFVASYSFIRLPGDWFNTLPFWTAVAVMVGTFLAAGFLGWHSPRLHAARLWLRRKLPESLPARKQHALTWGLTALSTLMFWPVVLFLIGVLMFFVVAPPHLAAKADTAREWKDKTYESWDRATWTTDTGEKRVVYVHSCTDMDCAILDEAGGAHVVARERVGDRHGKSRKPMAKPAAAK